MVGVDGTPLRVAGYGKVTISLTHITLTHPVLVVDSLLSEGILGLDFLQHHNCSVDLAKGKSILYVGPHRVAVPLSPVTGVGHNNCISVIIAHTICIPERSEMEIAAMVQDSASNGGTYLLEAIEGGKSSALIARAVVSPTDSTVIVRVLNPQNYPITLHRNTKIAVMQEIHTTCIAATNSMTEEVGHTTSVDPKKCQMLWEIIQSCQATLSETEKRDFYQFLLSFEDIFCRSR